MVIWLYGLSGSGKTTLANKLKIISPGAICFDGDIIRKGVNSDLGFSLKDRAENIRRIIEICKLFCHNNMIICSFISPIAKIRKKVKKEINGHLIYCKCSIKECQRRDVKGLYANKTKQMTGIDSPFEDNPGDADLVIDTEHNDICFSVNKLREYINTV